MGTKGFQTTTARQLVVMYFVLLVINSLVVVIANMLFPKMIVLGTGNISYWWAVFHSMGKLVLIGILSAPLIEYYQEKQERMLTSREWMYGFWVVNFVGLWVISRFSEQFGLGLAAWWVTLALAGVMVLIQEVGMMLVYKKSKV